MPLVRLTEDEEPQPNLAPMIDVVLVLTIFFMCATRFSGDEHALEVDLPKTSSASAITARRPEVVEVAAEGSVKLRGEDVPIEDLPARLESLRQSDPAVSVLVRGDRAASHGRMAAVYEACRAAGIGQVGIAVQVAASSGNANRNRK